MLAKVYKNKRRGRKKKKKKKDPRKRLIPTVSQESKSGETSGPPRESLRPIMRHTIRY